MLNLFATLFFCSCTEADKDPSFATATPTGSVDADQDGLIASQDCDDQNPDDVALAGDCDQDGILEEDDCDDYDAQSTTRVQDGDCDSVLTEEDCDDANERVGARALDQDCDGAQTEDDCDDEDADLGAKNLDQDCDGTQTEEDCDDEDDQSTIVEQDGDCDGVLTEEDCDDTNPEAATRDEDADCDGVSSDVDCDDQNPLVGDGSNDQDCDGFTSDVDCDDSNPYVSLCQTTLDLGGSYTLTSSLVPGGTFLMGSSTQEDGRSEDETQHQVTLTHNYYVSTTEISQGMFFYTMGYPSNTGYPANGGNGDTFPAYYVSWHMAAAFANQMTARHNEEYGDSLLLCYNCAGSEALTSCTQAYEPYECSGYRLLTEAEWERAARAGSNHSFWTFGGGGSLRAEDTQVCDDVALSDGTSLMNFATYCATNDPCESQTVMSNTPNGFGLYNMHGNVMEWVHDSYASFGTSPVTDPLATPNAAYVSRGGHACSSPQDLRAASRNEISASSFGAQFRDVHLGFRVGRTVP